MRAGYDRISAGGVTTLEVKSGYGLTEASELRQLELLDESRAFTSDGARDLVSRGACGASGAGRRGIHQRGARRCSRRVVDQDIAAFHDITCERGLFTPAQAARLLQRSRELGIPTKVHADAWQSSEGWRTAVAGGAVSAEHLTYTPDSEIREVGATDTVAVLLPQAELVYMTERRANARLLVEQQVPVAIATDYCSSIHATSLPTTIGIAGPWFSLTPAETIVGATLERCLCALAASTTADRSMLASAATSRSWQPSIPRSSVSRSASRSWRT